MPQGDKSKYTGKQQRRAAAIAASYEDRGVGEGEAERRAWATVNKEDGGGKMPGGSGRGKPSGRSAADRSASARKAAATRRKNRENAVS